MIESNSIWDLVERRAAATGDWLFSVDERGQEVTFGELRERALRVAAGLAERGITEGSVVSWLLPNWSDAVTLTLALARIGAIQNPIVPILRFREVDFICAQAGTELLVVPGVWQGFDYAELGLSVARERDGLDVYVASDGLPEADPTTVPPNRSASEGQVRWYFYTSGTTAEPKGAMHTDQSVIAGATGFMQALDITEQDRVSLIIPVTHIGGIIHVLAALTTGCALVLAERFDPEGTTKQLRDQGATLLPGGPPFVQAFFDFQDRHPELSPLFSNARAMIHGGSPKPPHLHYEATKRLGTVGIISGYGMTECPMLVWGRPTDGDRLASTEGRPVAGAEVAVVGPDESYAGPGEEGEIRVRGPQLMTGYVDAALDDTALDNAGYFRSGDLGKVDADSFVTITGRLKDVIIRNMENISATELENLLYQHSKVAEVAVIGIPNDRTGEHACAVVVAADTHDPPTLHDLCEHLLQHELSKRKLPEQLEMIEELPRNAMGKVIKASLRTRLTTSHERR